MQQDPAFPATGCCQCGAIRYVIKAPFLAQIVCHCTDCQKLSATAFSISSLLETSTFELTQGELRLHSKIADSGETIDCYFCPDCGNRIYHQTRSQAEMIRLKPGTLDNTALIEPTIHVWIKSKQDWVVIPEGVECYETQPF